MEEAKGSIAAKEMKKGVGGMAKVVNGVGAGQKVK